MPDSLANLFDEALNKPADGRAAYIDQACGDDEALRKRLHAMIAAHEDPNSFLEPVEIPIAGIPETTAQSTSQAGMRVGNYKLLQKIGEGGFGVVFMAEQEAPVRRQVALKIVKPGMDTDAVVARFEAERQALAMMDHPHIAKVFDGGAIDADKTGVGAAKRPYFVMELVKGVPITDYCDANSLSTHERLRLFIDVCQAVQHAHQKGIIHRDIKPSNVMVTLHDGKPVVKVIDFGVAKAVHQKLTERTMFTEYGQMIGTPQYMSPEQAEISGLDVDTRSDIYSLSVLLYELLTGSTPLEGRRLRSAGYAEIQRIIREEEPPKPSHRLSTCGDDLTAVAKHRSVSPDRLHRELQGDLDWIVMKGLEKDRQRRYESAQGMAQDVRRFLADEPVDAGPPSAAYRMRKWLRRNRQGATVAGVMTALLLLAGGWYTATWLRGLARQAQENNILSNAIENASLLMGRAVNSSIGEKSDWVAARASRQRILDLLENTVADEKVQQRAQHFLEQIDKADADRQLAARVEEVVITGATHDDAESWAWMEQQLRDVFKNRGIDFDKLTPAEVAERIRHDESVERLGDALELWIATRVQLSIFRGEPVTGPEMQPWANALFAADPDPVRTGIRKIIYAPLPPKPEVVEQLIAGVDLDLLPSRTSAWLAGAFSRTGDVQRSEQIFYDAVRAHPDDLMLNFDFGLMMDHHQEWDRAIRYYMRCTALRPDVSGLWRALGVSLRNNDELDRSREALEKSVELQPDHPPTWLDLAKTQLAHSDPDAALASARRVISLSPDTAPGFALYGRALMDLKRYDEALEALTKSAQLTEDTQVQEWIVESRQWIKTQSGSGGDEATDSPDDK